MHRIAFLFLLFPIALSAQEDCQLFNIQGLASENLALRDSIAQFSVDTVILQPDGSFEVQLSNGTTFTQVQGCTNPAYTEYNAAANTDDGSCSTLLAEGCTDSAYLEYDAAAVVDDGSCSTLLGCTDSAYLEYDAGATYDDGSCVTFVDPDCVPPTMDGYDYDVVQIGDHCWFAENLRTTTYSDGAVIPAGLNVSDWKYTNSGATAVYGEGDGSTGCVQYNPDIDACDEVQSLAEYGRLYNWYAVNDARGLCPVGWHVPTDEEWTELEGYITSQGFDGTEGTALKSTTGWHDGGNGTDDFGFSALSGGRRFQYQSLSTFLPEFFLAGKYGFWWTSTPNESEAWGRSLQSDIETLYKGPYERIMGFSVRCLMDYDVLGCTDPVYLEYNAEANTDDGSCTTLLGCTDSAYLEYDAAAGADDGSCSTLLGCTYSAYLEYDAAAVADDGSCATLLGCTDSAYLEYDAAAGADDGSCAILVGCSESDVVSMDGADYGVVTIGDQCWFTTNLRTTVYANGNSILEISNDDVGDVIWTVAAYGAHCVYPDALGGAISLNTYGRLYNWYAVDDSRGLCPSGWHVPTDGEWTELEDYIISQGFDGTEGTALKSTSWSGSDNGTDDFGFSALPGGYRRWSGHFYEAGFAGSWWSSSPDGSGALARHLQGNASYLYGLTQDLRNGFSVRCLRDGE